MASDLAKKYKARVINQPAVFQIVEACKKELAAKKVADFNIKDLEKGLKMSSEEKVIFKNAREIIDFLLKL